MSSNFPFPPKPNYVFHATANWVKRNLSIDEQPARSVMLGVVSRFPISAVHDTEEKRKSVMIQREAAMIQIYHSIMEGHDKEEQFKTEVPILANELSDYYDELVSKANNAMVTLQGLVWVHTSDSLHEVIQHRNNRIEAKKASRQAFLNKFMGKIDNLSEEEKENMTHRFNSLFN